MQSMIFFLLKRLNGVYIGHFINKMEQNGWNQFRLYLTVGLREKVLIKIYKEGKLQLR